jgi:cytosine/adenosine deaminase-related metal-dependent hydrolase
MNASGEELFDVDIHVRNGVILAIGRDLEAEGAESVDLSNHVVLPGLINTHHHFFQTLTRAVPAAQDASLFDWLKTLYPIWSRLTPEMIRVSTQTAMCELLLSGCTTSSDHLYLYPNDARLDDAIEAAREIGMRFHATRGSMSVGESDGGLPPDSLVEDEDAILKDSQRLIETWHDPSRFSMVRVALAPCSPFSVSTDLMRESAAMARQHGVGLHTHLAENDHDVAYSLERFGRTPAEYAEDLGWLGDDVWHAHCVKLDAPGIARFAGTSTGVAHCPCSNMRLASGIAPVRAMLDAGVPVGLGVDGSASNDSGHLLSEARQAMLLQRVAGNPAALTARQALRMATAGGAAVLGRDDIGQIEVGMAADIAAFRIDGLAQAGALHDPIAALVFGRPQNADHVFVHGRHLVSEGRLRHLDARALIARHNSLATCLANSEV